MPVRVSVVMHFSFHLSAVALHLLSFSIYLCVHCWPSRSNLCVNAAVTCNCGEFGNSMPDLEINNY